MARPRMTNSAEYQPVEPFRFDGSASIDPIPTGYSLSPKPARAKRGKGRYVANMRCAGKTPCGEPCAMNGALAHSYHSCNDAECGYCHADSRFGRRAR